MDCAPVEETTQALRRSLNVVQLIWSHWGPSISVSKVQLIDDALTGSHRQQYY